jgi:hypothetical protein
MAILGLAVLLSAPGARAQGILSTLQFPPTAGFAGERNSISIESITDFPYQGFSVSATYDPAVITIVEITSAGTIVEAVEADFFEANVFPENGAFVIGCLVDSSPPFDDRQIPGTGLPLAIAKVIFDVGPAILPQSTNVQFKDGFGTPPIFTVLSVSNQSVQLDRLIDGVINILRRAVFVRGDANQDTTVDIADPIYVVNYLFQDRAPPPCMDAADGNDDESVDLADAIFVLQYYFMQGLRPPAPFPNPGTDPTRSRRELGCINPGF